MAKYRKKSVIAGHRSLAARVGQLSEALSVFGWHSYVTRWTVSHLLAVGDKVVASNLLLNLRYLSDLTVLSDNFVVIEYWNQLDNSTWDQLYLRSLNLTNEGQQTSPSDCLGLVGLLVDAERWTSAVPLARQCFELLEEQNGRFHEDTCVAATQFSNIAQQQDDFETALAILLEELGNSRATFGPRSEEASTDLNNLGNLYTDMGRFPDAIECLEEAIDIREEIFGTCHERTATSQNNLGLVLNELEDYTGAEKTLRQALESRLQLFGVRSVYTSTTQNNLAICLTGIGFDEHQEEIGDLRLNCYETRRDILGPSHPRTLTAMLGLARHKSAVGEIDEAIEISDQVLALRRQYFGEHSGAYASALSIHAGLLIEANKMTEGGKLLKQSVELSNEILGEAHPDTLTRLARLAFLLLENNEVDEGLAYLRDVYDARGKMLGQANPATIRAGNNYAQALIENGRAGGGIDQLRRLLRVASRSFGFADPKTQTIAYNLVSALEDQGHFGEAIKVQLKLVVSYEADPEDSADDLANAYEDLARLYANSGQFNQSRRSYEQAIKSFEDIYGSSDEDVLRCKQSLGVLYRNHGRPEDGIGLLEDVVSAYRTQQKTSDLGSALMALGSNVYLAGDREAGFKVLEESLEIRRGLCRDENECGGYVATLERLVEFYEESNMGANAAALRKERESLK
jgi:tetratricopeptide (TPR) repeat protein